MEKNGNTWAPDDPCVHTGGPGSKHASQREKGSIIAVDPDSGQAHVKFASYTRWVDLNELERP